MSQTQSKDKTIIIAAIITGFFGCVAATIGLGSPITKNLADRYIPTFTPAPSFESSSSTSSGMVQSQEQVSLPNIPTETPYIQSPIASEPIVVSVSATKGWQGTGVMIKVGDDIKIRHKEGLWQSTENEVLFGPDPHLTSEPIDRCFPLPSDPGALIGMIGNYESFKVGYSYETISNMQGELFLRMNDCDHWLYDNRDEFEGGITGDYPQVSSLKGKGCKKAKERDMQVVMTADKPCRSQ